jgi:hypothetical protein
VVQPSPTGNGFIRSKSGTSFTSLYNGRTDPGALNIEFEIPIAPFNTPRGQSWIRVWGVGLGMLAQASDLSLMNFTLKAGMQPGLPLATAAFQRGQAGIIAQGQIYRAFGNWQGVNQTLDLITQAGYLVPASGVAFMWKAGTTLASAIATTLQQAFPQYKTSINISPSLVLPYDYPGIYENLWQFAGMVFDISQKIGTAALGPTYRPVSITIKGSTIYVFDSTYLTPPKQLIFQDLIGQSTWIDPGTISFKAVLRCDIDIGTFVLFPSGISSPYILTAPGAAAPGASSSSKTAFQGQFVIRSVTHYANFRQADADSWVTAYEASPTAISS